MTPAEITARRQRLAAAGLPLPLPDRGSDTLRSHITYVSDKGFTKLTFVDAGHIDNFVDDHGFHHRHEVPPTGQFRLQSMCNGCDALDAKVNGS